jgi:hypothetical protein
VSDESLFREVDEEVRQEQYQKLWNRYGNYLIAVAVLIVASVAGFKGFQYWQIKQAEAAAAVYLDAVKTAEKGDKNAAAQALAGVSHAGFRQLAQIEQAALLAETGKTDEAVRIYEALAADANADPQLRDLAAIRAGYLQADTATPDQLLTKLGKFDRDDNPWRLAAREIFAISAYRTADFTMADRYFNAIFADPTTPQQMRQRAQAMIQLITPKLPAK